MRVIIDYENLAVGDPLFAIGGGVDTLSGDGVFEVEFKSPEVFVLRRDNVILIVDPKTSKVLNRSATIYPSRTSYQLVARINEILKIFKDPDYSLDERELKHFIDQLSILAVTLQESA